QAVAGDDTVTMAYLATTGHYSGLDQVDNAVGDHVAMDAEVSTIRKMAQGLVGHAAQPDLQRRAIFDDRGDVARDALADLAALWMAILRQGRVNSHQRIDAVEMDEAVALRARHLRVDLGDHVACHAQNRRR